MTMSKTLRERFFSAVCAAAILFSPAGSSLRPIFTAIAVDNAAVSETAGGLSQQSLEVYPNGEYSGEVVTLEGMLPEGAEAEVVDVSEEHSGVAAYDITITGDDGEFQPAEGEPIFVEITNPDISGSEAVELWHITDDGVREQVTDFTLEDGKISFYATGFSVYEIVTLSASESAFYDAIASNGSAGIDVSFVYGENPVATQGPYYFTGGEVYDVRNPGRTGLKITGQSATRPDNAKKLYFERKSGTVNEFYIYFKTDSGDKQYIRMFGNNWNSGARSALELTDEDNKTAFTLEKHSSSDYVRLCAKVENKNQYWIRNTKEKTAVVGYNVAGDATILWMSFDSITPEEVPLDGKTYGLMNYTSGTHGYALMADENDRVHSLVQLVTHNSVVSNSGAVLYVDEGSEVTRWTFHSTASGKYKLSAESGGSTGYLTMSDDALGFTTNADEATEFTVTAGSSGTISLSSGGKKITHTVTTDGENTTHGFAPSASTGNDTLLYLVDFTTLSDDDLITYSADRVSVSEVEDGTRVIVYTRIWDETNKKYDIYAIDYNGNLYPCYASGGKILWLGDGTCSLEWVFTEYRDAVTKEPNYYYELYNPYSEKYIAPQMEGGQILSDSTIGISMQGRRDGEFYSQIGAWDDTYYTYVGMTPNEEKTKLVPCSLANSIPFYFATLEELNLSGKLHEVATVDNNEYGITIKVKDFEGNVNNGEHGGTDQIAYLGDTGYFPEKATTKLLSTDLDDYGYPTTIKGKNLGDLYSGAQTVNNLFIESVHNSSGYFEFDSTQNFATLCNEDGTLKALTDKYTDKDGNVIPTRDFTVYRELGTSWDQGKTTLQHGQFFPYNSISAGNYSRDNPQNLYGFDARPGKSTAGLLPDSNPRKYEKLLSAGSKSQIDYYFGMEMSAQFVQTVSGLDTWGHDMIFEFTGDDDFWLYVDNELVIDLGGIHSALDGRVNFRTGEVYVNGETSTLKQVFIKNFKERYKKEHGNAEPSESEISDYLLNFFQPDPSKEYGCEDIFADYSPHTMRIFYMERGAGASNIHMRFNLASVTPGHVVVSKSISGEGAEDLDKDFLEYPFQIYYTLPGENEGDPEVEYPLSNDDEHIRVSYQNSSQSVTYVRSYRPPGFTDEQAYKNVYFINPTKSAEIAFPDKTIRYRIVECAVDDSVYSRVLINGNEVPAVDEKHGLRSYTSDFVSAEDRPSITFDNVVNDNVVKDLYIHKKLVDEDGNEIFHDPATFNFRLYISSLKVDADSMPKANMYRYYVLAPNGNMCRYDYETGKFVPTDLEYSHEAVKALTSYCNDITEDDEVYLAYNQSHPGAPIESYGISDPETITFTTSGFGAISRIPAGYTICVPGLPVGTIFKVTEDVKPGFGIMGYERVYGEKILEDGTQVPIASYKTYGENPMNVGEIRQEEDAKMDVVNRRGYGLTVNKKWSDLDLTTSHETVYVAVYADGNLVEDSVKAIESPSISTYYFWTTLEPNADGTPRTDFTGYEVSEVRLTGTPTVAPDGTVSGYDTITRLNSGAKVELGVTRTAEATPPGENKETRFEYSVSYTTGTDNGSSRTDTINNIRTDGLALRLFKWDSSEPLSGGSFTLTNSAGDTVGKFTSDSEGLINIMYSFEREQLYTLVQDSAPNGYVGMQKTLRFKVKNDDTVELYYADGTTAWGSLSSPGDVSPDGKWAEWKPGENGITAFVDIHNKPFNFKIMKTDSEDSSIKLESHFALYKQSNTSIIGYSKNKDPMTGFEDMVTVNGEVYVCGGDSGRVINPGVNGSVFFLTETQAPLNYSKLNEDIVFNISPLGIPTLITADNGVLVETEDSYIYTLSVPNVKSNDRTTLAIDKRVEGTFGSRHKDFTFTVSISGGGTNAVYEWTKNSVKQPNMGASGTFTMRHGDRVVIALPVGVEVTVTEANEDYETTFSLNSGEAEACNSKTFTISGPTNLLVVNSLSGSVATGIVSSVGTAAVLMLAPLFPMGMVMYCRRRRRRYA